MNKVFKVIWNETKHDYCVVSEIAHMYTHSSTNRSKVMSCLVAFLLSLTGSAYAALTPDQQAVYDAVIQQLAQTSGTAALGKAKVDNDKETLSLGYVQWDGKHGNLYLGTKAAGNEVGTSQTQYTHGIPGSNIAWGSGNVAGRALEAQTEEATVDGKKTNIITGYKRERQADGFSVPLWNINLSGDARSYSTAIGFLNAAYGVGAFSVGQYSAAGADSAFAGGYGALASAKQAFAFGKEVKAMGENSVALGEKSEAWATNSFAVGNTAKAQDVGAVAMGNNAVASGKSSFAAGVKSNAKAYSTVALGDNAAAEGNYSVAMGHKAKATEENSSAVGTWAKATGQYSSALGASSKALGFLSTAVGGGKVTENGDRGLSMGYGAQTTVADGVSVGSNSVASRSGNVYGYNVLGGNAYDTESIGAAYGQGKKEEIEGYDRSLVEKQPQLAAAEAAYHKAKQDLDDMFHGRSGALEFTSANQEKLEAEIARTKKVYENLQKEFDEIKAKRNTLTGAYLSSSAAVSVGNEETGMTRQITGVAAGTKDTDAVNVAQLKVLNTKVDKVAANSGVHYFSVNSSETGEGSNYNNDGAKGVHAVAIGAYATADIAGGVALGSESTAKRAGGLFGYNPKNGAAFVDGTAVAEYLGKTTEYDALQTEMTAKKKAVEEAKKALKENAADTTKKENLTKAYQALEAVQQKENLLLGAYRSASGYGAFSVGNEEKGITRQITGVAAGTKDTDAVNVAQLKVLNTKVDKVAANSTAYTVETKENDDNTTTVTIKSNKAGDKGTAVTVATKDIHITSGTYDKTTKKLTFTTNTNTTFNVDMNDVINAAAEGSVHYLSVNSSETGEGSNYKNDGAKAKGSIVLGVRSSSEGINGVVVGNDNKLTGIKNNQNNSVVIGTGLNVDGVHNIVVGTNYENYDQKETKVKGEQNTVIGNGNLVGYTAEKDPNDATKWKYTEVSTSGSDRNVVVGSCNTANGSSVAVGTSLEVEDLGRAFGSGNTIIGSTRGGGQWGLALGSNNTVKGEKAVSVGTDTNALGDWTVAIGSEAKTNKNNSIAMGYQAVTAEAWSAAIGSNATTQGTASTAVGGYGASATVDYGAAFGSYSVAQRASGVAGYLANGQKTLAWKSNLGAFSVGDEKKGYSRQITGVAAGSKDSDAVNVAQLKALEKKLTKGGSNVEVQGDQNTGIVVEKNPKENKPNPSTGGTTPSTGGTTTTPAAENKTVYKVKLDKKIDVGHISIDGTENKENVVVGDVKINGEKGKGTITGLSNKTWDPNHIESGRAATEDQLQQATQNMQNHIYEIGKHMNGIAASNAALAGLHPLEYDEDDKWNLSAAIGNYKGANAFALGAFYQPNERTMLSIGGTLAGEEHLLNVGLSLKTGPGTAGKVYVSRAAMAREIKALKEKDARRDEQINQQKAEIKALKEKEAQRDEQIRKLTEMIVKLQRRA